MTNEKIKEAYQIVINDIQSKSGMLMGKYDAKNGNDHFMYGVATVIEFLAYEAGDLIGNKIMEDFNSNIRESKEKTKRETRC